AGRDVHRPRPPGAGAAARGPGATAMTPDRPGWRAGLARLLRLARKELSESLRDRRTVLTLVLMPALHYPILALAFQQFVLASRTDKMAVRYRIAVRTEREARLLKGYWDLGRQSLMDRHGLAAGEAGGAKSLAPFLDPMPQLDYLLADDPLQAVST